MALVLSSFRIYYCRNEARPWLSLRSLLSGKRGGEGEGAPGDTVIETRDERQPMGANLLNYFQTRMLPL